MINLRIDTRASDVAVSPSDNGQSDVILMTRNLNFWYGNTQVLENIDCDIRPREVTAIIGPSGCGKSTFLRCFNRMNELIPTARIAVRLSSAIATSTTARSTPSKSAARSGMVFQKPNPFPKSIFDNVAFGLRINGYRGDIAEAVETLPQAPGRPLGRGQGPISRSSALALSGGQQQRLCIARAHRRASPR